MAESVGWGPYLNGSIPASALTGIGRGYLLEAQAAQQFAAASAELMRDYGIDLLDYVNETYRDLAGQQYWKAYWTGKGLPSYAATPGYSMHGRARAVDFNADALQADGVYEIVMAVLYKYGFRRDVAGEPWHVTYQPAYVQVWASAHSNFTPIAKDDSMSAQDVADLKAYFENKLRHGMSGMLLIQCNQRGIAVAGGGYFKGLTEEELPYAVDAYGWPIDYADNPRAFDLMVSISLNGISADQAELDALKNQVDAEMKVAADHAEAAFAALAQLRTDATTPPPVPAA